MNKTKQINKTEKYKLKFKACTHKLFHPVKSNRWMAIFLFFVLFFYIKRMHHFVIVNSYLFIRSLKKLLVKFLRLLSRC